MLVKVSAIPPNKSYILLRTTDGKTGKFPRQFARHLTVGDVCLLSENRGRPQLKLLTDDDEVVIMSWSRSLPPARPPEPIPTPEG